jgi:hypothetical protein
MARMPIGQANGRISKGLRKEGKEADKVTKAIKEREKRIRTKDTREILFSSRN